MLCRATEIALLRGFSPWQWPGQEQSLDDGALVDVGINGVVEKEPVEINVVGLSVDEDIYPVHSGVPNIVLTTFLVEPLLPSPIFAIRALTSLSPIERSIPKFVI